MSEPVLPAYGRGSLRDILPAVGAHLGVPGHDDDPVGLPSAKRYVLFVIDGLGWSLLSAAVRHTGYFAQVIGDAVKLTAGVPSTTATSITSIGTGLVPGRHGMAGYTFRNPDTAQVIAPLSWRCGIDPYTFQPRPPVLQQATQAGVAVSTVVPRSHVGSPLSLAALRGGVDVGIEESDDDARIAAVVDAAAAGDRSLVYTYDRRLDHTGHGSGVASQAWLDQLIALDAYTERLRDALGPDVVLLVTGDHGMIDVPPDRRVLIDDHTALSAGLDAVGGEGRFRHLYTSQPDAVARRWRDVLGDQAWVLTRAEAADWFGGLDADVADRFGDVVVALRGDWAVLTRSAPGELGLVGMHGSLTAAEMYVPLLID